MPEWRDVQHESTCRVRLRALARASPVPASPGSRGVHHRGSNGRQEGTTPPPNGADAALPDRSLTSVPRDWVPCRVPPVPRRLRATTVAQDLSDLGNATLSGT